MRILAIDHGMARAGTAVCDPTETLARPLEVVEPPEPRAIAALAEREGVELVVVGLPVSLDGEEGDQARLAREFAETLTAELPIPVETYDERLTTRLAAGSSRAGARGAPDSLAAAHLLESYLQFRAGAGPGGDE